MDAHLNRLTEQLPTVRALALLCAGALWCAASVAADIADPTQPPAPLRAEPAARGAETAPTEPLRLQMIVRGPGEARFAIVDGRALRLGDSVTVDGGSARVVRITEGTLVVRHADHRTETIELVPAAQAVRCTRTVGAAALPCATDTASGLEKSR